MTETIQLKPCPFCAGEAALGTVKYSARHVKEQGWDQDTFHSVNCVRCGADNRGIVGHRTPSDAARRWNHRISDASA